MQADVFNPVKVLPFQLLCRHDVFCPASLAELRGFSSHSAHLLLLVLLEELTYLLEVQSAAHAVGIVLKNQSRRRHKVTSEFDDI